MRNIASFGAHFSRCSQAAPTASNTKSGFEGGRCRWMLVRMDTNEGIALELMKDTIMSFSCLMRPDPGNS